MPQSIFRIFGCIVLGYIGTIVWLEGALVIHIYEGKLGPPKDLALPVAATAEVRKLETKSFDSSNNKEEPNFLPRVLAFVFPQFHRDCKQHHERMLMHHFVDLRQ